MPHDLVTALAMLPVPYASAIRLRIAGATPHEVGEELGLEESAIMPLLAVAEDKLRTLLLTEAGPEAEAALNGSMAGR